MKRWIYTAAGDDLGLEQRLNKLAEQGLELVNVEDSISFFGDFQPTKRRDLRYFVEAAPVFRSEEQLRARVEQLEQRGWEGLGTINALDVYCSAPLRFPEEETVPRRSARPLLELAGVWVSMLACFSFGLRNGTWYLSHLGVFLYVTLWLLLPLGTLWSVWRLVRFIVPAKQSAPEQVVLLRGMIAAAWRLWWVLLVVCIVLTLVPPLWAGMILALGALLYLSAMLDRTEKGHMGRKKVPFRWKALCVGMLLLLSIGVNGLGVSNTVHSFTTGSAEWGRGWMIHPAQVTDNSGEITSTEYRKRSSFLVQWESVSESAEHQRVECQRYTCLIPGICEWFVPQEEGKTAWAGRGNQLLVLHCTEPWDTDPRPLLEAALDK